MSLVRLKKSFLLIEILISIAIILLIFYLYTGFYSSKNKQNIKKSSMATTVGEENIYNENDTNIDILKKSKAKINQVESIMVERSQEMEELK